MKLINTIFVSIIISLTFISNSYSQGVIQQFGPLTAGDLIMSQGNNRAVDAGSSIVPTVPGTRIIGGIGVVNSINGYCQWDQDPGNNTTWDQLCLGFNNSIGSITYNNIGTPANPLTFSVNGFTSLSLNNSGLALLGTDTAPNPPPSSSNNTIATTLFVQQLIGTVGNAAIPWVGSNAGLEALSTVTSTRVMRCGVTASNDAPCVIFLASNSSCTISGGDIGTEVPSADGKCWLISAQTDYDIRNWGLTSNPVNFYISRSIGNDYGTSGSGLNFCVIQAIPCLTKLQAVNSSFMIDVSGGNAVINALAGGSNEWDESIFVNSKLRGAINSFPNPSVGQPISDRGELIFNGNGTEIWNGNTSFCGTLIVSDHAVVGVQNMALMSGTGTSCQSTEFDQMGGILNNYAGNTFGPASVEVFHSENPGTMIQFWKNYTVNVNTTLNDIEAVSEQAWISHGAGVGTISGNTTVSEFLFGRGSGNIQFNITPAYNVTGTVNGRQFTIVSNAVIDTGFDITSNFIPGNSIGAEGSGAQYHGPIPACIGGSGGCNATVAPIGLGTGNATLAVGSTERSGEVFLNAGTGAGSSGQLQINFPILNRAAGAGAATAPCVANMEADTTGEWAQGSFVSPGQGAGAVFTPGGIVHLFFWGNSVTPLTPGATYAFSYSCYGTF